MYYFTLDRLNFELPLHKVGCTSAIETGFIPFGLNSLRNDISKIIMKKQKLLLLLYTLAVFFIPAFAQNAPETFHNPVMSGFNPDPSICRAGDDYYMVTSSFTWYPGIPVYHSKDLVNWELVGHALNRPDMVRMEGLNDNDGIWAVTIRYHDGLFYVITTASKSGGNFYCTAKDPAGPWSDPVWLKDAEGIDPSLFWDTDNRCYYTGNTWNFKGSWPAQCAVWLQELDLKQQKLVGQKKFLAYGHANNAMYAEGPHLYKIDGKYMLLMAEGGSGHNHAVTAFHSKSLWGPYVADQINPVLTHRHLGQDYPIQNIGHADLVQTPAGWYSVCLGNRVAEGLRPLGRETFLCQVDFENDTPIYNVGQGRVLEVQKRPNLPWTPVSLMVDKEEFETKDLPLGWYFVRIPRKTFYRLSGGRLEMTLQPQSIDSLTNAAMIVRKLKDLDCTATTALTFTTARDNEKAGLVLYRSANGYFTLMKGRNSLTLERKLMGKKETIATVSYMAKKVLLKVKVEGAKVRFFFAENNGEWKPIGNELSMDAVADNKFNKFNGTGVGMYATSNQKKSTNKVYYDWFEYKGGK